MTFVQLEAHQQCASTPCNLVSDSSSVQSENFFILREWSSRLASSKACSFTQLVAIGQVAVGLEVIESTICRWC